MFKLEEKERGPNGTHHLSDGLRLRRPDQCAVTLPWGIDHFGFVVTSVKAVEDFVGTPLLVLKRLRGHRGELGSRGPRRQSGGHPSNMDGPSERLAADLLSAPTAQSQETGSTVCVWAEALRELF